MPCNHGSNRDIAPIQGHVVAAFRRPTSRASLPFKAAANANSIYAWRSMKSSLEASQPGIAEASLFGTFTLAKRNPRITMIRLHNVSRHNGGGIWTNGIGEKFDGASREGSGFCGVALFE
jgi:hypothetical protein